MRRRSEPRQHLVLEVDKAIETWAPLDTTTNARTAHLAGILSTPRPAGVPPASMPAGDHLSQARSVPPKQGVDNRPSFIEAILRG